MMVPWLDAATQPDRPFRRRRMSDRPATIIGMQVHVRNRGRNEWRWP
jgi:hypothetical protein